VLIVILMFFGGYNGYQYYRGDYPAYSHGRPVQ
jgi:hypothetical protein